mmetsp:Transcript_22217/g.56033  ORF Transcript_22217/g.56033 Transcript_22217/m.56033 type:complete len:505 (-) Transcript_22217:279-1793(-)|eukprot:CAMPEP_0178986242 /NCGR_PEP_ID=MMETSP0795-20121207/2601_1 /TAXON_ID=88552 /ORGANISM="Amoebophrya sp., Strain Ameob2" /LENGTH=504 /DNA_ID=CAMNT_0020677293 /DNA_START=74 /DNA_END=1588 /DNA_ORIENTATION=+
MSFFFRNSSASAPRSYTHVVIGGGVAAGYVVRSLVERGVPGAEICVISAEPVHPYERPALTKAYLHAPGSKVRARLPGFHTCVGGGGERQDEEWYSQRGVTVKLNTTVVSMELPLPQNAMMKQKTVVTSSGEKIVASGNVFVATGARARLVDTYRGANVALVRNEADCAAIVEKMEREKDLKMVIIGGGYIGLEVAAAAIGWTENLASVTVINSGAALLSRIFADAPVCSALVEQSLTSPAFRPAVPASVLHNTKIADVIRDPATDKILSLVLQDGRSIPCDLVVLGLGATPVTEFVPARFVTEKGFVRVDENFSFFPGCYAIGDCCEFPYFGRPTVFEHVSHARASARHAAEAALHLADENGEMGSDTRPTPYQDSFTPFFYSRMYEYSEKPLIWNMWGHQQQNSSSARTSKVHVEKKENGLVVVWTDAGTGVCVSSCVMMQNPAPTQGDLDSTKALVGTRYARASPSAADADIANMLLSEEHPLYVKQQQKSLQVKDRNCCI